MVLTKRKLGILFLSLIIVFIFGELSLRVIGLAYDIDFRLYNQELTSSDRLPEELLDSDSDNYNSELQPNTQVLATTSDFSVRYSTNSLGIRDNEYPKESEKTRILAFGDSLTFGKGVPYGNRFTEIAEKRAENTEIINFGSPGHSPGEIYFNYKQKGNFYDADKVFVFINGAQLIRDDSQIIQGDEINYNQSSVENASKVKTSDLEKDILLSDNSYLVSYLTYQWNIFRLRDRLADEDQEKWETDSGDSDPVRLDDREKQNEIIFREMNKLAESRGHDLVLINIGLPEVRFVENIDRIEYYSLSDELHDRRDRTDLRFTYDPHYNPDTHEFIGKELSEIISENVLETS